MGNFNWGPVSRNDIVSSSGIPRHHQRRQECFSLASLSHMTPLETVPFSSFCHFGDDLLRHIIVNQLERTDTKYPWSVDNRQSLCA